MIQPIETIYKGYRFRSRLEARWAVFFDTTGIKWEYEPEGYDIDGTWYLPDFRLETAWETLWLEIKPSRDIPNGELEKCAKFAAAVESTSCVWREVYLCRHLILAGNCGFGEYAFIDPLTGKSDDDFLWCECPLCHRVHPAEVLWGE